MSLLSRKKNPQNQSILRYPKISPPVMISVTESIGINFLMIWLIYRKFRVGPSPFNLQVSGVCPDSRCVGFCFSCMEQKHQGWNLTPSKELCFSWSWTKHLVSRCKMIDQVSFVKSFSLHLKQVFGMFGHIICSFSSCVRNVVGKCLAYVTMVNRMWRPPKFWWGVHVWVKDLNRWASNFD